MDKVERTILVIALLIVSVISIVVASSDNYALFCLFNLFVGCLIGAVVYV